MGVKRPDTSNFSRPLDADGRTPHFGNVGRGIISGPSLRDLDFSLFRKFQISERFKGEFRVESFNLTNTPNFANPNVGQGDANFGKVTGPGSHWRWRCRRARDPVRQQADVLAPASRCL